MVTKLFKQALEQIVKTDEYSKVVGYTKGKEKKELIHLRQVLLDSGDLTNVPIWALMAVINSPELYRDVITYMIMLENGEIDKD